MTDNNIKKQIQELTPQEQEELEKILQQQNTSTTKNTSTQQKVNNTTKKSSNNSLPSVSNEKTKKLNPLSEFLNFNSARLTGIYPVILNPAKLFSLLKKEKPETTPQTSRNDLGVGVNIYGSNNIVEANENKVKKVRLDNDFNTTLDVIKLFADEGNNVLSPKSFINCINALIKNYKGSNKQDLLTHISYLAEVIFQHFSTLVSNETIKRDDFFKDTTGLNVEAVRECDEFFFTDYLFLTKKEKDELMKTINSYYLEES